MTEDVRIEQADGAPTAEQVTALRELAAAAQAADGAPPFSEQTLVELDRKDQDQNQAAVSVVFAWAPEDALAGAGVVVLGHADEAGEGSEPNVLELVVHPEFRRQGIGTQLGESLTDSVLASHPGSVHRAWAHGGHPGGPPLAAAFDWTPVRELWRMRLENSAEIPPAQLPAGIELRSFRPGQDEEAWLGVNSAAFADHPEQGRLTMADLTARMGEDWFDPEGFFLAWETGQQGERLLGFHWTKLHAHQDGSLGEVYVVGVAPSAQGSGLGAALTAAGIAHLRSRDVDAVILYVDAENTSATELYKKLGFTVWDIDVQYAPLIEPAAEAA